MSDLPSVNGAAIVRAMFGNGALPPGAHAGLVFDRYLRIWSGDVGDPKKSDGHREDLRAFVDQFNRRSEAEEHRALLDEHHARLRALAAPDGERTFRTTFRLATGLGQEHPLENGFVFDPVIGVPFLPGSSIKGLLRAYLTATSMPEKDRCELLGHDPPRGGPSSAHAPMGSLIVLPAFPKSWPRLAVDVINCHHPAYYASGGRADPVDWENPNPVYFLAIDSGVEFTFRLAWRSLGVNGTERSSKVAEALDHLERALADLGIGAKTAVGYGVMTRPGGGAADVRRSDSATPGAQGKKASGPALDASAIAGLLRAIDKGNAAAKVPELLKLAPAEQRAAVARDIVKKLGRKWVEERKGKPWAAELLAAVPS